MRRTTIALLAALEAFVAALVGLGAAAVPLVLYWALHFGLAVPIDGFVRAAADAWLLGHGVDIAFRLDASTAAALGLTGAASAFVVTIALLGFALVSAAFGFRIGRRATHAGDALIGVVASMVVFAAVGATLGLTATHPSADVVLWQAIVLPTVVVGIGAVTGAGVALRRAEHAGGSEAAIRRLPFGIGRYLGDRTAASLVWLRAAARIGVGAATAVLGVAALLVTLRLILGYSTVVGLSQSLAAGVDGGLVLLMGELALIPNLVVWAAAWMLGPGFELGTGNLISPSFSELGPVPGIPVLGVILAEPVALPWLWLAVPALAALAGGYFVMRGELRRRRAARGGRADVAWWAPVVVGAGSGLIGGAMLGLLAWWSAGAVGPGRLSEVGPDAWPVTAVAAGTIGLAAIVGALVVWTIDGREDAGSASLARWDSSDEASARFD